jgi:hypothetical protein
MPVKDAKLPGGFNLVIHPGGSRSPPPIPNSMKLTVPLLILALVGASITSCVVPVYPAYGYYTSIPSTYVGDVYFWGGRYYYGGRYETGRYYYHGRHYSDRYYHQGHYYYGGRHEHREHRDHDHDHH